MMDIIYLIVGVIGIVVGGLGFWALSNASSERAVIDKEKNKLDEREKQLERTKTKAMEEIRMERRRLELANQELNKKKKDFVIYE